MFRKDNIIILSTIRRTILDSYSIRTTVRHNKFFFFNYSKTIFY
jgi:hypothetical protein